jgi:cellulose biosynthesis protein BcsQ
MTKSLVAILHYNTPSYTDTLYELLKPYEREDYDLIVIDNGSDLGKSSKYATFRLEENVYFGGGLMLL